MSEYQISHDGMDTNITDSVGQLLQCDRYELHTADTFSSTLFGRRTRVLAVVEMLANLVQF